MNHEAKSLAIIATTVRKLNHIIEGVSNASGADEESCLLKELKELRSTLENHVLEELEK